MATAAASSSPAETADPKPDHPETLEPPNPASNAKPDPSPLPPTETPNPNPNPNPNPSPSPTILAPPSAPSFTPSFRPAPPQAPQFSPLVNPPPAQNPSFQAAPASQSSNLQPPGVAPSSLPPASGTFAGPASGAVAMSVPPPPVYYSVPVQTPGVAPRPYWQHPPPNGYPGVSTPQAQGLIAPPGVPRYPGPYPAVVRPGFPPRPPVPISVVPPVSRSVIPGTGGTPVVPPVVRPVVPFVAPTEKPQTTVYVGKIASTVDNDFLLSLLNLCGPVKSWKRAQDPSDGTPRGFGFCEFESAEGVLRALRLLTKLNIDGQELVLNIKQATREYLERYVVKKTEREKHKGTEGEVVNEESSSIPAVEKQGSPKPDEVSKTEVDGSREKEKQDDPQNFGIVTDEDRDADKDALEKIKNMIEERLKNKPLPPPPPVPSHTDGAAKSNSELPSKSKEGESELNAVRSAEDKNEEITSNNKHIERDKSEVSSDRSRRRDRSKERDRERDLKRDKERELERYERERERERVRRERDREMKIREAERYYKDRVKDWEAREREKEYRRQYEREKEKEREIKRRRDIMDQEDESDEDDDDTRKRRHRSSTFEEKRRKVLREKEDDIADRLKEEEEVAEAKRRAIEEKKEEVKPVTPPVSNGSGGSHKENMNIDVPEISSNQSKEGGLIAGDAIPRNGIGDECNVGLVSVSDAKQSNSITFQKLGFGLMTSGKRTSVPSVFHEEDEDVDKDKKMRPLVPIDYSKEELQAIQETPTPPHLAAAAEFAKRISAANNKEEKSEPERERSRRNNERQRDRDRDDDSKHSRHENREKMHDKSVDRDRERDDRSKTMETRKLLDAKQLIDMIPKTKEELFSYEINWTVYEKHELHERMKPWISKKITEFLGEEEPTLVDYIVSSTKDHVRASEMLQLLQPILDEEAEMFVLKMWRMLIFEIKKVETGLSTKTRT